MLIINKMDIKKIRQSKNWTQKQMGKYLGCTEAQVCYLEKGKRKLTNKQLSLLQEIGLIKTLEDKVDGLYRVICEIFATPHNFQQIKDAYLNNKQDEK